MTGYDAFLGAEADLDECRDRLDQARADLAAAQAREARVRALCDRCEQGRGPLAVVPITYVRRALDGTDGGA